MTTREAMFAAAVESEMTTGDDTARLAYADSVQEDGDEGLAWLIRNGTLCECIRERFTIQPPDVCGLCSGRQWRRCCQHEGCREAGCECIDFYPESTHPETDAEISFFCRWHRAEHGYCSWCGYTLTGVEFGAICEECQDQEREDDEWDDFLDEEGHDDWISDE